MLTSVNSFTILKDKLNGKDFNDVKAMKQYNGVTSQYQNMIFMSVLSNDNPLV